MNNFVTRLKKIYALVYIIQKFLESVTIQNLQALLNLSDLPGRLTSP